MDKNKNEQPANGQTQQEMTEKPPLFRQVLSRPAEAVQWVLNHQPEEFIHRHYMLAGLTFVLATRIPDWLATTAHPIGVMIQVLFMGPIMGILLGYIFSAALRNVARLFDVTADKQAMRAITAWTNFPFALSYLLFLASYLAVYFLFPHEEGELLLAQNASAAIPIVLGGAGFIYALFLRWKTIHQLFRVSYPKAVVAWLLAFIITYGPIILIGFTYFAIYRGSMEFLIEQ